MIKRESLKKKMAIATVAGMLMLLLAASSVAQTPLGMSGPEDCTNCSANASTDQIEVGSMTEAEVPSSPGLENAAQEMNFSDAPSRALLDILVSPSGILNTNKPTYIWDDVDGCQYYHLNVTDDTGKVVFEQWYNASTCSCSVTPPESLDPGDYTWRILCWNCEGEQLSEEMEFTVCSSSSFPGRAILVSPTYTIGSKNPTFVWKPVTGCTQYCLKVANANDQNNPILEKCYNAEEVLSDQDCSITPGPTELVLVPGGSYRWWIQTLNCKGEGPWSYYKSFRYLNRLPGRSTPIYPRGLTTTSPPTFSWTKAYLATEYHLQVDNSTQNVVDEVFYADDVTNGFRCSALLPVGLPDDGGVYFWRIRAANDAGNGSWSSYRYFEMMCSSEPGENKKETKKETKKKARMR